MPRTPRVTARYPSNGHSTWAHTQVPLMRCRSLGLARFLKTVPLVRFSEHHWQYVLNPRTQNPETLTLVGIDWYRWKKVCG
jgi:hypothetical protein